MIFNLRKMLQLILIFILSISVASSKEPYLVKGKLLKTIRILTLNVYGKQKRNCEERLRTIGERVLSATPAYDIVSFNEHYDPKVKLWLSCDGDILTNSILKDGRYDDAKNKVRYHQQYPKGRIYQVNGGNSLFTLHDIKKFDYWKFSNHRKFVANGFMMNRIKIQDDLTIDVWTAHMESKGKDKCSDKCRMKQFRQIINKIEKHKSDNPVVLLGDFNIGGPVNLTEKEKHIENSVDAPYRGNIGYEKMLTHMQQPTDVWLEVNKDLHSSQSFTFDCYRNRTTYQSCEDRYRIDFIFIPKSYRYQSGKHIIEVESSEIVRWKTDSGQDVSDHYGVEATLKIYETLY